MIMNRVFVMPNRETFKMWPVKELLDRYVFGEWADPFAGWNSPATYTNDINPKAPTDDHMDALEWVQDHCPDKLDGFLFDPPYSPRQISESYKKFGYPVTMESTQAKFWSDIKNVAAKKIREGGYAICFGWNSQGFGKTRGFKKIEVLLLAHGGPHNDTIITVEKKSNIMDEEE